MNLSLERAALAGEKVFMKNIFLKIICFSVLMTIIFNKIIETAHLRIL